MLKKIYLALFILLLLIPNIHSIGVGSFVKEIKFYPNLNRNIEAIVFNNVDSDIRVKLEARGGLAEYVTFHDEYIDIPKGGRYIVTFNLKLPESIPPGRNRLDIGAIDVTPPPPGGGIRAVTAAYKKFIIVAPYPGKYIEATFNVNDIGENEIAEFNIKIASRGSETINKIDGIIEIFSHDSKIAILPFTPIRNIEPGESRAINVKWDSEGQPAGDYNAKTTINYDNEQLTLDTGFKIGTLLVKIINYTKEFYEDEINQFDIEIQSFWNRDVGNVYGEIEIYEQKIKTLKTNLAAWGKTKITAYWDATDVAVGDHTSEIKVYYEDKVAEETAKITVLPKREKIIELPSRIPSMAVLLVVIVFLLIGNSLLVLYFIKKIKGSRKVRKLLGPKAPPKLRKR